jgi:hypothetical protein
MIFLREKSTGRSAPSSVTPADHACNFLARLDQRYRDQSGLMEIDPEAIRDRLVQFLRYGVYLSQLDRKRWLRIACSSLMASMVSA